MKKIFKWTGIIFASLIALIIISAIALALFLPLDKIKEMAASQLSSMLHRQVKIEKASFNIFTGLKLEKLTISDAEKFNKRNFISADAIELHYDLWPLLQRKIVIKKIGLVKPEILIEKSAKGDFNFSDMIAPQKPSEKKQQQQGKLPFELFINSFFIKNGKITYSDRATSSTSALNNFDLSISGFDLSMAKPVVFKASSDVLFQKKIVPIALSGRIKMDMSKGEAGIEPFSLSIAGETANMSIGISNLKSGPDIALSLSSKKISVDPLMSIFAGGEKKSSKPVDLTTMVNQMTASIPGSLTLKASVDISNLTFQGLIVDRIDLSAGLVKKRAVVDLKDIRFYGGKLSGRLNADLNVPGLYYEAKDLKLTGFDAHPFSNYIVNSFLTKLADYKDLRDKIYGKLNVALSFKGRGVDPKVMLKNLTGDAKIDVTGAEIKKSKILSSIGELIRSNSLKGDIKAGTLNLDAGIRNSIINVRKLAFTHHDLKLNFAGGIDLNRLVWVAGNRLNLKLAPHITSGVGKEYSILRDPSGWLEATFELTGTLKMPIPKPILDKPIENLKKKAEAEINKKVSEETERLKKEAGDKIRELIKF